MGCARMPLTPGLLANTMLLGASVVLILKWHPPGVPAHGAGHHVSGALSGLSVLLCENFMVNCEPV